MRRLHLLVEGQTEEVLFDAVIGPYLAEVGWVATRSILTTKRAASGAKFRGGVGSWDKIRREINLLLRSNFDVVTTMIDYYRFPDDAPGMADRPAAAASARVQHVEEALRSAIGDSRFVPHLALHETEAWVFAAADAFGAIVGDPALAGDLRTMAAEAGGPELINDHPTTAPSKRLHTRFPTYQKTLHGPRAVETAGLDAVRAQCPHLDAWLSELEERAG